MPSNLTSRHNTRRHASIQGRDNKVDHGQGSRLSLLRNMRDRGSPGKSRNSLRSLPPRTGLKAEAAAESLASIWFLFHSNAASSSRRMAFFV
jgi:hypothetical protein